MALFHFDLRHLEATDDLEAAVHGVSFALQIHDDASRAVAATSNAALAVLPVSAHQAFTHFAGDHPCPAARSPYRRPVSAAMKWGLSPLDWRSHAVDERRDHPIGVLKAECGHLLMMVTTLHDQ